ncbi:MAG TPA: multiheme c-type cytochrome [Candidatus Dormibacteraeota bacterium]|nr:multiheme c-type cytochrome [Candidatus Dormibacteraeota bacterium]
MRLRTVRRIAATLLGVTVAALLFLRGAAEAAEPQSARVCSSCHGEIKKQWEKSSKAQSWTNPVFQAFLADAKATLGEGAQAGCISCHAPLAAVTGDVKVTDPVNQEGITCNFCHGVSAVDVSPKPASYTWDAADPNLLRGPFENGESGSAHGSVQSPIMTQGEFCASCHWYAGDGEGLVFEGTHAQWKASKAAAAGKQCQDCHMPPAPGKASLIAKQTRDKIWAHTFAGAHTAGGLDSVASVAAAVESGKLKLTVRNTRGGHSLPGGGASMRAITLDVVYQDGAGKELARVPVQTYDTEFADANGKSPVPKWLAKKVARSNEIPPDEPKVEWSEIPAGAKKAVAVLTYHFLLPAYRDALVARKVDLTGRDPVVMARASVAIP